jgi:hypothetical protein
MDWNNIDIQSPSNQTKTNFLTFPEGTTIIRIASQPIQRRSHWLQSANVSVDCLGAGCPVCEMNKQAEKAGELPKSKPRNQFMFYVIDRADGELKIVEQGINFMKVIKALQDELKEGGGTTDVTSFDLRVRRSGMTAQNTSYTMRETTPSPLTEAEIELIKNAKPINDVPLKPNQEQMIELLSGKSIKDVFGNKDTPTDEIDFRK